MTTTGSTVGEGNQVGEPSCVFTYDTPDATFLWTAPATATYQLDTQGSDFDTVLSVRDATCTGTELACNDDDPVLFPQSRLFVSLAAGQQVVIVVTGVGDQGAYVLHMALAPPPCLGDCDHNGVVTVDELLEMVNIALGNLPASACLPGNANGDDQVTVDEILAAVSNALSGCPAG